jgi:hypothetical protein
MARWLSTPPIIGGKAQCNIAILTLTPPEEIVVPAGFLLPGVFNAKLHPARRIPPKTITCYLILRLL